MFGEEAQALLSLLFLSPLRLASVSAIKMCLVTQGHCVWVGRRVFVRLEEEWTIPSKKKFSLRGSGLPLTPCNGIFLLNLSHTVSLRHTGRSRFMHHKVVNHARTCHELNMTTNLHSGTLQPCASGTAARQMSKPPNASGDIEELGPHG